MEVQGIHSRTVQASLNQMDCVQQYNSIIMLGYGTGTFALVSI